MSLLLKILKKNHIYRMAFRQTEKRPEKRYKYRRAWEVNNLIEGNFT